MHDHFMNQGLGDGVLRRAGERQVTARAAGNGLIFTELADAPFFCFGGMAAHDEFRLAASSVLRGSGADTGADSGHELRLIPVEVP